MKITTDVNSAGLRPAGNVMPRPSTGTENRTAQSDAGFTNDVIIKMQKERSMVDALALAQSSRELVQKAINISSRLLSLASEAMRTGRMDINDINSQISNIQGSMGNYGEKISVPVGSSTPASDDFQMKMEKTFVKLKEAAADIAAGNPVAGKEFDAVRTGLNQIASELDVRIKNYISEFSNVKQPENSNFDFSVLNKSTADFIVRVPGRALMSQGNINADMAGKLTIT